MKTIKFFNEQRDIDVEYLVDLIGNSEPIAIYDVTQFVSGVPQWGLNGEAIQFGMFDKNKVDKTVSNKGKTHTPYTVTEFVEFAKGKNLTMVILEDGESAIAKNTLTAFAWVTETIDAGVSGHAQLDVLTFPATTDATQGDYIVLENASTGETAALWLDIDEAGTEPTGDAYVAADYKILIPIVAAGTAADNAALAVTAIEASDWATGITLTDNKNGTVDFLQDYTGDIADPDPNNANDSGVGSITTSQTTAGTDGTAYEFELKVEGGVPNIIFTTEDTLPVGLELSTDGVISGTPREVGTFTLTITATDHFGNEVELENKNLVIAAE